MLTPFVNMSNDGAEEIDGKMCSNPKGGFYHLKKWTFSPITQTSQVTLNWIRVPSTIKYFWYRNILLDTRSHGSKKFWKCLHYHKYTSGTLIIEILIVFQWGNIKSAVNRGAYGGDYDSSECGSVISHRMPLALFME